MMEITFSQIKHGKKLTNNTLLKTVIKIYVKQKSIKTAIN